MSAYFGGTSERRERCVRKGMHRKKAVDTDTGWDRNKANEHERTMKERAASMCGECCRTQNSYPPSMSRHLTLDRLFMYIPQHSHYTPIAILVLCMFPSLQFHSSPFSPDTRSPAIFFQHIRLFLMQIMHSARVSVGLHCLCFFLFYVSSVQLKHAASMAY